MRKMRCLLSGLLILTMMVGMLGGCSSANPSKEKKAATSGSGAKVTLKVQLIGDFKQDDSTDPVSGETRKGVEYLEEEFEKQNQQIDLQYVIMGWDDYQKKTQSMMLAGEADVYQAPGIGALAEQDLLEPLQPYIDKDKFDLSVYIDGQVEGWKVVGVKDSEAQIYGLPMIADTRFIVYDKQLFDEWGVPYLSSEPTLEEIMDAAKKTTGANPVSGTPNYGVTFAGKDAGDTVMNMNEYYGGTWGTGNKACELVMNFNTETMVKAMNTMLELINYAPTGVMANQGAELFGSADNNIAINLRCNPAVITSINSLGLSERYAVARLFINDKEGMGGMFAGSPVVMAANSKVKEAAWEYIKFTASDFFAQYFYENQKNEGLPVVKSALNFKGILNDKNVAAIMETLQYLWTPRYVYRSGQPRSILTTAVEEVTLNGKDPAEVLASAQKEAEEWIAAQ